MALKNLFRATRKRSIPDHFMETSLSFWAKNVWNATIDLPNTVAIAIGRLTHSQSMVDRWELAHFCEPEPNPESRITIGQDTDRLGLKKVKLD